MRAIKFRGKAHGRWVYGGLVYSDNIEPAIYFEVGNKVYKRIDWAYVDPATVGQFTGLHDKHGHEIYEGDILLYNGIRRTVEWKYGTFGLSMHENGFPFQAFYELLVPIVDSTVVGNIYDNFELLKNESNTTKANKAD